jgi:beta-lactamase superfamily II metal-dependent hydrolase
MKLKVFEASKGDCFALSWGAGNEFSILIDAGIFGTYRFIKEFLRDKKTLHGIIATHVDYDHIGGFIKLFQDTELPIRLDFPVYINTPELVLMPDESDLVNYNHGEILTKKLDERQIERIGLYVGMNESNTLIINGLKLQIISPNATILKDLVEKWNANEILKSQIKDEEISGKVGKENKDLKSVAEIISETEVTHAWETDLINSSSIAFIAEYNMKNILFLADSNPDVVCEQLDVIGHTEANPLIADAVKLGHHGSKYNTTQNLLKRIKTNSFILSTNGTGPYYHPNRETIVRIAKFGRRLNDNETINIYTNYDLCKEDFINSNEESEWGVEIITKTEFEF